LKRDFLVCLNLCGDWFVCIRHRYGTSIT